MPILLSLVVVVFAAYSSHASEYPELIDDFDFSASTLEENGWLELPGGFESLPPGNVHVTPFPAGILPSSTDRHGVSVTVQTGQVAFIYAAEPIETEGYPILVRMTIQASSPWASMALIALRGDLSSGADVDGSLGLLYPVSSNAYMEERRLVLVYEPDQGDVFTPAFQVAGVGQNANASTMVWIDRVEILRLDPADFGAVIPEEAPTPTPTSTPSLTPTPIIEPTPTPTDTPMPIIEPTPTPSATPTPTNEPTPTPTSTPEPVVIIDEYEYEGFLSSSSGTSVLHDGYYADVWQFTLDAPQEVVIEMHSDWLDAFLILYGGDTPLAEAWLAEDDDGGAGTNAYLQVSLNAGIYSLEAMSWDQGEAGFYKLISSIPLTPAFTPPPATDYEYDGFLFSSSGQSILRDGNFADVWQFTLGAPQEVVIEMNSNALDAYLILFEGDMPMMEAWLAEDDDGGVDTNARLHVSLDAGTYSLEATTWAQGEAGGYTLRSTIPLTPGFTPPPATDYEYNGFLSIASSQSVLRDGNYADVWLFTLGNPQEVVIEMRSGALDAYLILFDGDTPMVEAWLAEDDDGGGDTHARLHLMLEAGTYSLEATAWGQDEAGGYTLRSTIPLTPTFTPPPATDYEYEGFLSASSSDSVIRLGHFADVWQFTLDGQYEVLIEMMSDPVDSYLILYSGDTPLAETWLTENDDGGEGANARLHLKLNAGTYSLEATTWGQGEIGSYILRSTIPLTPAFTPPPDLDYEYEDELTPLSEQSVVRFGHYTDVWQFTLGSPQEVVIELRSDEFDAYLILYEGDTPTMAGWLAEDDDGGGGSHARLHLMLDAGNYSLETTTWGQEEVGAYTLRGSVSLILATIPAF